MPNHARNHLAITGPPTSLKQIHAALVRPDFKGGIRIDFNTLIPMPPDIRDTASQTLWVDTQAEADQINAAWKPPNPGGARIRAITRAEARRRIFEHGAANWRDWADANWGTISNAYGDQTARYARQPGPDTQLQLTFTTAWCAPLPLYTHIEARWPGTHIHAITLNEDESQDETHGQPHDHMHIERAVRYHW